MNGSAGSSASCHQSGSAGDCELGSKLRSRVVLEVWYGRLDLIHLLAWQKLKFYHQLRHSSNTVVFHVFQYLQYDCDCDYLQLCATYSFRQFDSLSRLKDILMTFVW